MKDLIFETERLYVRRFNISDDENFFLLNSDQDVMLYIRPLKSREESLHFLQENIDAYAKSPMTGRWAVFTRADNRFAGTFAIIPMENSPHWQIGYALLKQYWGQGYATELTDTGIWYAFRKMLLSRLMAVTEMANTNSKKVLMKAGFVQKNNLMQDGKEICLFEINNPAIVESDRLLLVALDKEQLDVYIKGGNLFEKEYGLMENDREISVDLADLLDVIIIPGMRNATARDYFFFTIWTVIDKARNVLVGELGFQGIPNERGEVELGYGTFPSFRGNGFMTEALKALLGWATAFPGIKSVTAQTAVDNQASIKILEKNGFELINKLDDKLVYSSKV
jgi:ribosomal-protein-alanine N-acetyltransferase